MPTEGEPTGLPLTAIHINLKEGSIELEAQQGPIAKLTFPSIGTIYFQGGELVSKTSPATSESGQEPATSTTEDQPEREKPIVLSGRLVNKPREGRADRSGNKTAYARLAAHVEGEEAAHDYMATFHRHTAATALGLPKDAQVTVEGYPHPSNSEKRMDTFSVINLINYSGKPREQRGPRS